MSNSSNPIQFSIRGNFSESGFLANGSFEGNYSYTPKAQDTNPNGKNVGVFEVPHFEFRVFDSQSNLVETLNETNSKAKIIFSDSDPSISGADTYKLSITPDTDANGNAFFELGSLELTFYWYFGSSPTSAPTRAPTEFKNGIFSSFAATNSWDSFTEPQPVKGAEISDPTLLIDNVKVDENAGQAIFTVNLTEAINSEVTVDFTTVDGTANAESDYVPLNGTLSFAPGTTEQKIEVAILSDTVAENNEVFFVKLFNPIGARYIQDTGVGKIVDDDDSTRSTLYRINVGGPEIVAADGSMPWSEDTKTKPSSFRVGNGGEKTFATNDVIDISDQSVPASTPPEIFKSERYDPLTNPNMQWELPVTPGSNLDVRLFFAEIYSPIDSIGERVFSVEVEESVPSVFEDIDPFAIAGQNKGFVLSHKLTVLDDSLSLGFLNNIQNPALKGIEVVSLGDLITPTPVNELESPL